MVLIQQSIKSLINILWYQEFQSQKLLGCIALMYVFHKLNVAIDCGLTKTQAMLLIMMYILFIHFWVAGNNHYWNLNNLNHLGFEVVHKYEQSISLKLCLWKNYSVLFNYPNRTVTTSVVHVVGNLGPDSSVILKQHSTQFTFYLQHTSLTSSFTLILFTRLNIACKE